MKKGLVSICIPTFNRIDYLQQAIHSSLGQTYKNIEIIISDNGNCLESIKSILKKYNFISYHRNQKNIGSVNNLQKAAHFAQGEYIKFLLDDDLLKPTCVEEMVNVFSRHPSVGIVMAPLEIIDHSGQKIEPLFYFVKRMKYLYRYLERDALVKKEMILCDFLTKVYPCCVPTGYMIKKQLFKKLGGLNREYGFIADLELCMHAATQSDFYYINKILSSWRYTPSSETISILHRQGINSKLFYTLAQKYCALSNCDKRRAFLFASKRAAINITAGMKSHNIPLLVDTIRTIYDNDPYLMNKCILPFSLFFDAFLKR